MTAKHSWMDDRAILTRLEASSRSLYLYIYIRRLGYSSDNEIYSAAHTIKRRKTKLATRTKVKARQKSETPRDTKVAVDAHFRGSLFSSICRYTNPVTMRVILISLSYTRATFTQREMNVCHNTHDGICKVAGQVSKIWWKYTEFRGGKVCKVPFSIIPLKLFHFWGVRIW